MFYPIPTIYQRKKRLYLHSTPFDLCSYSLSFIGVLVDKLFFSNLLGLHVMFWQLVNLNTTSTEQRTRILLWSTYFTFFCVGASKLRNKILWGFTQCSFPLAPPQGLEKDDFQVMCHWQRLSNVHSNLCSLSDNSEVEGNISSSMPTLVTSVPCSTPTTSLALSHRFLRILLYPDIKQVRRKKEIEGWLEGCISWVQGSLGLVLETSSQLPQFISRLLNIMSLCPTAQPFSFLLPIAPLLSFALHKDPAYHTSHFSSTGTLSPSHFHGTHTLPEACFNIC